MNALPCSSFGIGVATIDGRPAGSLNDDRRLVRAKEGIAVAAVDAAVVPHRIHRRIGLLDQQLVQTARPGAVGIAEEVARRRVVDEQRRVVHVAVDAPRVVLRHLPLAAAQRRQRFELSVPPAQVPDVLGRVDHVVHRPEQAVGVVLDAAVRVAVGVDDEVLGVGLEVAVGVFHQPQVRRLADEHAVIEHLQGARHRQLVGEHGLLVHRAVAVRVFQHADPVERLARVPPGRVGQEGQHLEHPQPAVRDRSPSGSATRSSVPRRRARREIPAAWRRSSSPLRETTRWTSPSASWRAARCSPAPWRCLAPRSRPRARRRQLRRARRRGVCDSCLSIEPPRPASRSPAVPTPSACPARDPVRAGLSRRLYQ